RLHQQKKKIGLLLPCDASSSSLPRDTTSSPSSLMPAAHAVPPSTPSAALFPTTDVLLTTATTMSSMEVELWAAAMARCRPSMPQLHR
ncbi:unnamed protein product, partial [Urochloa humidicola]